jgi:hypothetical protein
MIGLWSQEGARGLRDAAARVAEEAGSAVATDVPGLLEQLELGTSLAPMLATLSEVSDGGPDPAGRQR